MCAQVGLPYPCDSTAPHRGPIEARIALAVEETNAAFEASGILTSLRLVRVHEDPTIDDSDNDLWTISQLFFALRASSSGFEYVSAMRNKYGADFVVLITERTEACGIAPMGPSPYKVHSVVSRVCSTGYYTFGHELGHNMVSGPTHLLLGCMHS